MVVGGYNDYLSKIRGLIFFMLVFGGLGISPAVQALGLCDTATPLKINASTGVLSHVTGQDQYFKITTPSAGLLSILTTSNMQLDLALFDKDCFQLTAGSIFNQMSEPVDKNTYFVAIRGNSGNYKIQVDGDFAADDHGVGCTSASIVRSTTESGIFGPFGDHDFFQINLTDAGLLKLLVTNQANANVNIQVFDKNCFLVTSGAFFNSINRTFSPPGVYYVDVFEGGNNAKGNYILNFSGSNIQFPTGTCNGKPATLSGTNGDDVIKGTAGNDVIQAFGGNDVVYGLAGNDTLCGGTGDDVLQAADGLDTLLGEGGNDVLQGGNQNDALDGGTGSDICDGGALTDTGTACEVFNLIP